MFPHESMTASILNSDDLCIQTAGQRRSEISYFHFKQRRLLSTVHSAPASLTHSDVSFTGREPTLRPCTLEEFKCTNGHCVALQYVCDHNDNCGDRTDELGCSE